MDDEYRDSLARVGQQYPALAEHLQNFVVQSGNAPAGSPNQLEYYHPWEDDNPNPGKATLEIYNKNLKGPELDNAVAGDALHYLGTVNPNNRGPIDPDYYMLKQKLANSMTPGQASFDRHSFEMESKNPSSIKNYDDWMQNSRLDAYIRGYITPDKADEWRKQGVYTPEQEKILEQMILHLKKKSN